MSWVVENIIERSLLIRAEVKNSLEVFDTEAYGFIKLNGVDVSSCEDLYDDLLTVEMTIKKLYNYGIINDRQLEILNLKAEGQSFTQVAKKLGLHKQTIAKDFVQACRLISDYLGEHFTLNGYVDYITKKYKLNYQQRKKLKEHIEGKNYTRYWRNNAKT